MDRKRFPIKFHHEFVDEILVLPGKAKGVVFVEIFNAQPTFQNVGEALGKNTANGNMDESAWQDISMLGQMKV